MRIVRFLRNEDGSDPFAPVWFVSLAMLSSFAVDTSNVWRHAERLGRAASAAAHAGGVELARGGSAGDIREAAAANAVENVAETDRSEVFRSLVRDIELVRFDGSSGTATTLAEFGRAGGRRRAFSGASANGVQSFTA